MITDRTGVSVFFPCYNDQASIGKLITTTFGVLKKITKKYEIIIIDDGSTDQSREILQKFAKKHPKLRLIFHKRNRGYGGALKSGFKACRYEYVFYTDGDGQYDVGELPLLICMMKGEINFVNGIKQARMDPTYRVVIGNIYSFLARWMFWLPIHDVDCDFRLIKADLVKKLKLRSNSGTVCIELVKRAQRKGGKFRQVSITHLKREFGSSQFFRPKHLLTTFLEITRLWLELIVFKNV